MRPLVLVSLVLGVAQGFSPQSPSRLPFLSLQQQRRQAATTILSKKKLAAAATTTTTQLSMVFDFFQKRSQEGVDQLSKLSQAASRGKLGQGLKEAAAYTAETNAAFANGLAKSRARLLQDLELLFTGGSSSDDLLEELQDVLLQADLGTKTTDEIVQETRTLMTRGTRLSREDLLSIIRGKLVQALEVGEDGGAAAAACRRQITFSTDPNLPTILFIMGANGMGKTTTIGKLAHRLKTQGNQTVLVAACDTFRAGAVEQLQQWADRAGVECYTPTDQKSTPSAVLYGALDYALEHDVDTVLVDTSGRLSNNHALTLELKKMKRVIQKRLSVENDTDGKPRFNTQVPHETLLVLDAAQGRMALDSAKVWEEEIGLTGLILTKLDGTARGGSVVAVSRELNLPVKLIGVGEGIDDLRDFEPQAFVDGLLGIADVVTKSSTTTTTGANNQGALLAARLKELQKDRDDAAAAKTAAAASGSSSTTTTSTSGAVGDVTLSKMNDASPPTLSRAAGPSQMPNRNKKRKNKGKKR